MIVSIAPVLALVASAAARKCMNATVPVDVSARTAIFGNVPVPQTNPEVVAFIQKLSTQGSNYTAAGVTGYQTITKTYNISTQFCTPDDDKSANPTVQVLTHGIGFDKAYWDLPYNNYNYSYVNSATAAGYCTLSFDRLGIGASSHGEPRDEIQAALEVGALYSLTTLLREGRFPSVPHAFTKVVHVGHSFGSVQTLALAAMYPDASDAVVLTGFSTNSSFTPYFLLGANFMQASTVQPLRFGSIDLMMAQSLIANSALAGYAAGIDFASLPKGQGLPNGYLSSGNAAADQILFLLAGYFDPMLAMYAEQIKQPVTIGELLTVGSAPMMNPYKKPVLVITGREFPPLFL